MPKPFDDCIKAGGKVRTKKLGGMKYMNICFINGKSYAGDVKTRKANGKVSKAAFMRAASGMK